MEEPVIPKKKNATRKWGRILIIEIILIVVLIPAIYLITRLGMINKASKDQVNKDDISMNDMDSMTQDSLAGYRNIAFFGVDSRDGSLETGARSDAILIASINTSTKDVKLVSVYRDTLLYLGESYGYDKATHAYAYGGAELAMSMLNTNFDLDITEFVTVDFGSLAQIIDALGGLDIELSESEVQWINEVIREQNRVTGSNSEEIYEAGMHHLDGTQAVAYSRIRKADNDFKRTERQRLVISKMLAAAKSAGVGTILKLVDELLPNIYTDLSYSDIISLASDLTKYDLGDQSGFPFENVVGYYGDMSCVFADGLLSNVSELHSHLFGNDDYTASSTVQNLSDELLWLTGY
ncbi:MAG: LCP family protein [Lachnospiraceae bacterium]|nr:LCP family protein [Lachnospiraceae bacterium]